MVDRMLTVKEVANRLRISEASAYSLVRQSDFPAIYIGRRIVVPEKHFGDWIDKQAKSC